MSQGTTTQNKLNELKSINTNLKQEIKNVIQQSSQLVSSLNRKKYLSKLKSKPSFHSLPSSSSNNNQDNSNILNDLPTDQQISIYQNSITALRGKIEKISLISKIEKIENEIKGKQEKLIAIREENKKLKELYNLNLNKYDNFEPEKDIRKEIEILITKCHNEKEKYKSLKQEDKSLYLQVKTQNNEIFSLNTKCNFIKENISLKKSKKHPIDKDKLHNEIENLENKVKSITVNVTLYKNGYENEIMNQKGKVESLSEEIKKIEKDINKYVNNQKISQYFQKAKMHFIKMDNYNKNIKKQRPISSNYKNISLQKIRPLNCNTNKHIERNKSFVIKKGIQIKQILPENNRVQTEVDNSALILRPKVNVKVDKKNNFDPQPKKTRSLTPIRISDKKLQIKVLNNKKITAHTKTDCNKVNGNSNEQKVHLSNGK